MSDHQKIQMLLCVCDDNNRLPQDAIYRVYNPCIYERVSFFPWGAFFLLSYPLTLHSAPLFTTLM